MDEELEASQSDLLFEVQWQAGDGQAGAGQAGAGQAGAGQAGAGQAGAGQAGAGQAGAEITEPSERLTSTEAIATLLGADSFAPGPCPAGALAFVARYPEAVHVHLRRYIHSKQHLQNFAFARAIGDAVCFPDTPMSVVNRLHQAERQAADRAFAAEFLAPLESVIKMSNNGCDLDEIAESFNVSRRVVIHQIGNQDRIRQSCAALAA